MVRLIKPQCNPVAANCNPWDLQQTARVRVEGPVVSTEGHWVKRKATWEQGKTVRGSALTATTTLWRWCILYCAPSLPSPRQFLNAVVVVVVSLIRIPFSPRQAGVLMRHCPQGNMGILKTPQLQLVLLVIWTLLFIEAAFPQLLNAAASKTSVVIPAFTLP